MLDQEPMNKIDQVECPQCGKLFHISEAIKHSLTEQIEEEAKKKYVEREKVLLSQAQKLKEQEAKLLETQQSIEQQVQEQLKQERSKIELTAKKKAEESLALKLQDSANQIKEKDQRLTDARKKELELLQRARELEEGKKDLEVEVARKVNAERERIEEATIKKVTEEHRLKDMERVKQMGDMQQQIEDLKRKAEQGSQQLQGEVQELDLEAFLKENFPQDDIQPVAKGIRGADVSQNVYSPRGTLCGGILWESKRTKSWSEGWVTKLKDDQREAKIDVAVLVSDVLPTGISNFSYRNGIWITNRASILGLALALRTTLMRVALTKLAAESKDEKIEILYRYLTGPEFKQQVEAVVETFITMKQDLDKEKRAAMTRWAKQDKNIERAIAAIAGMHGDLQGLTGSSMQPIPALESGQEETEDGETNDKEDNEVDVKDIPF